MKQCSACGLRPIRVFGEMKGVAGPSLDTVIHPYGEISTGSEALKTHHDVHFKLVSCHIYLKYI